MDSSGWIPGPGLTQYREVVLAYERLMAEMAGFMHEEVPTGELLTKLLALPVRN